MCGLDVEQSLFHHYIRLLMSLDDSLGSLVRPKIVRSVHFCPATKKTIERKYTDMASLDPFPSTGIYPTKVSIGGDAVG